MSQSWNGLDLQTELSTLLGDTTTSFKAKVLSWINDIQNDICTRHDWPFLRFKGKKLLTSGAEEQTLYTAAPGAATVAIAAGGSLTDGTSYKVVVTYVDSNGYETKSGTESAVVVGTAVNKTINLTAIPTSSESLVSSRKIYIAKKASTDTDYGAFYYDQTISNNTSTTATITTETTSTIEPPDYHSIFKIDGNPFFESTPQSQLDYLAGDQLRMLFNGAFGSGSPIYWSDLGQDKVLLYPKPSSALTLSYYYYKLPSRLFAVYTSEPTIPVYLKTVLRAGVVALGYEYRDRDGQEGKRARYEELMSLFISRTGEATTANARVRDVTGDSDGWSY